jgi:hypothetical protein
MKVGTIGKQNSTQELRAMRNVQVGSLLSRLKELETILGKRLSTTEVGKYFTKEERDVLEIMWENSKARKKST